MSYIFIRSLTYIDENPSSFDNITFDIPINLYEQLVDLTTCFVSKTNRQNNFKYITTTRNSFIFYFIQKLLFIPHSSVYIVCITHYNPYYFFRNIINVVIFYHSKTVLTGGNL